MLNVSWIIWCCSGLKPLMMDAAPINDLRLWSVSPSAPDQAGGASPAGQRPTRQSLRAAGRFSPRAGAEQPQAGSGEPGSPAEDPGVSVSGGQTLASRPDRTRTFPQRLSNVLHQAGGDSGAAADAGGWAPTSGGGVEAESSAQEEGGTTHLTERLLSAGAAGLTRVSETVTSQIKAEFSHIHLAELWQRALQGALKMKSKTRRPAGGDIENCRREIQEVTVSPANASGC